MIALACTLASAVGFYFSLGLGEQWWLAWLAPVPVLWYTFGEDTKAWRAFLATFAAMALGGTSILAAYAFVMPVPVLVLALAGPALLFAASAMVARRVDRTLGPLAAMLAFGAAWAALDYLSSFSAAGGAVATPAASQVGAPLLIQSASLVGFTGITFLLGFVAAGLALALRLRAALPAGIAAAAFAANLGLGAFLIAPQAGALRVALIDSDDAVGAVGRADKARTFKAIDAYAGEIAKLGAARVHLIVLPENIANLAPEWRGDAEAKLAAAAAAAHATLVAGFNTQLDGAQRNVSLAFAPGAAAPVAYMKRRLVVGLETPVFTPGPGPRVLADGTGLEICKDMDFQAMIRDDEVATKPRLLAVPAWDFGKDDWSHARVAILRSVENGVPMARTARDGLLTLNDRYGRVVARAKTNGAFRVLIGDLPLSGRGGATFYDRIGDAFAWLCLVVAIGLYAVSFLRRKNPAG